MKNIFLFCAFASCTGLLFAQNPAKCYHLDGWDIPHRINKTHSKGYAITGDSDGGIIVLIVDENGNELVKKSIQKNDARGFDIHALDTSGYIISGYDYIYGEPGVNVPFVLRTDAQGNQIWYREFTKQSEVSAFLPITSKHVLNNHRIVIATRDTLRVMDTDGELVLEKNLKDFTQSPIHALNIGYAAPFYYVFGYSPGRWTILKIDEFFASAEVYDFIVTFHNVYDFIVTKDKGFLISGQSSAGLDWQIAKIDSVGGIEWDKIYTFQNFLWGYPYAIAETEDGFLLAGTAARVQPYDWCPLLVKTDKNGSGKWLKEVDLCDFNNAVDALIVDEGKITVAGRKYCGSLTDIDIFIIHPDTIPTITIGTEETTTPESEQHFVFPNPFCKFLQIDQEGVENITLFDLMGRKILSSKSSASLEMGGMSDGVYFAKICFKNGNMALQKVIKQCR